jgi:hypothetical protein
LDTAIVERHFPVGGLENQFSHPLDGSEIMGGIFDLNEMDYRLRKQNR